MKKALVVLSCVAGFLFSFSGIIMEERPIPVLLNGRPFVNAVTINGIIAVSVEELAKAFQTGFKVQGTTLSTISPRDAASGLPTGKRMHKPFVITKQADVSSHLIMRGGKPYAPLADVIHAFGAVLTLNQANPRAGQPISLSLAPNENGILAFGQ